MRIDWEALFAAATDARLKAYAPYSRFKVGAALLCEDGTIVSGCNVENASYGLSVCAERHAIGSAVRDGKREFLAVAVVADSDVPTPPCGTCRQVIAEFAAAAMPVRSRNLSGKEARYHVGALLPFGFNGDFLKKRKR